MKAFKILALLIVSLFCCSAALSADENKPVPDIATFTASMEKVDGFFPYYKEATTAELFLEIPAERWNHEFLLMVSLPRGIGSNDIGIDRGQIRSSRAVVLQRSGAKALLIAPNYGFRAEHGDAAERRSVEEAFARSVIAALPIVAADGDRVIVDVNAFLQTDLAGVADTLRGSGQGNYQLDAARCAIDLSAIKNFPLNTETETIMTFAGRPEGAFIRSVTPDPKAVTVNQRVSWIHLPDVPYDRRADDPRCGYYGISFQDYSTPIDQPLIQRFISRHRLVKRDPTAAVSEAVQPIIYYVDNGAPEPVRTALVEGASWWNQAFEAAGFRNAFQVKVLPEGADLMDVRYNVIQWVHRSTRGWSYGNSVVDPRSGEILKGHVSLGSLRVRQDYLIATALTSPYADGKQAPKELMEMALARIRQLSAHEVGHTLGLQHNFAASYNGRDSVMDYPHPLIRLKADGSFDFSDAYTVGIGDWDKLVIRYGYSQFAPSTDETAALRGMLDTAYGNGMLYITDEDARPAGGAHPFAHLWDNGSDPAAELTRVLSLRSAGLKRFGLNAIRAGEPLADLENVLVPLYFFHRYQAEAAVKTIGGLYYEYWLRGSPGARQDLAAAADQRAALAALLNCVTPENLTLPENILKLLAPPAPGYDRNGESFNGSTGPMFDPLAAADSAAGMVFTLLLHPQRANRLVIQHARDAAQLGLEELLATIDGGVMHAQPRSGLANEVRRTVAASALRALMQLAVDPRSEQQTRALVTGYLESLAADDETRALSATDSGEQASLAQFARDIRTFLADPSAYPLPKLPEPPPGMPIGSDN